MTRICIFGDTGDCKTVSSVIYLYFYAKMGYKVFSNIQLMDFFIEKNYKLIKNTGFTEEVDKFKKNIVLIDEVGKTLMYGATTNAIKLSDLVTQSRKSVGEFSHMVFNTQTELQINDVLRELSDLLIYSSAVIRAGDVYKNLSPMEGRLPLLIKHSCEYKVKDDKNKSYFVPGDKPIYYIDDFHSYLSDIPNVINVNLKYLVNLYDTYEEVERFGDGEFLKHKKKYETYINTKGTIKKLTNILTIDEHLNPTEADRIARAIIYDLKG